MRKFLIGLLILGGVIAAIAVVSRRRSGSGVDGWDSFATEATEAAKDTATKATEAAKDTATKATEAAKDNHDEGHRGCEGHSHEGHRGCEGRLSTRDPVALDLSGLTLQAR